MSAFSITKVAFSISSRAVCRNELSATSWKNEEMVRGGKSPKVHANFEAWTHHGVQCLVEDVLFGVGEGPNYQRMNEAGVFLGKS